MLCRAGEFILGSFTIADSLIDFYLFTHRPQSLSFKKDETGTIVPDFESNVYIVFEDTANPLTSGEYPEILVRIPIAEGTSPTVEYIANIMSEAIEIAKLDAQDKASKRTLQSAFNPMLADYVENIPAEISFE